MGFIVWIIIGGLAGWAASKVMKGGGQGILMNIVIGIVGALIGGVIIGALGFQAGGLIASFITAFIGAVILLWAVDFFKRRAA